MVMTEGLAGDDSRANAKMQMGGCDYEGWCRVTVSNRIADAPRMLRVLIDAAMNSSTASTPVMHAAGMH
jgi:hypothetical protein